MPIIRNPFRKQDENQRPGSQTPVPAEVNGTKPIEIKEPTEYKLSGRSSLRSVNAHAP